jgi:UDP-N-acetylglucosamine 3-dehydrogenase
MTSEIKVGIIGYGGIGRLHGHALGHLRGVKLTAVSDPNPARLEGLDADTRRFSDYHDLLQAEIDAVIVCSPTAWHSEITLDALARGKHVLVEKPMATNVEQGQAMCDSARNTGRVLMVGMTHRFYPELQMAKRLVDDGGIGEILMCNDSIIEPIGFKGLPPWYLDKSMAGGGVAMSDGIHLIDRVRWFTGDEVRQVTGTAGNKYFAGTVEDWAQMFLWFEGGASAQLTMAFMKAEHPLVCDLQVIGTKGSLLVRTWQGYTLHGPMGTRNEAVYQDQTHEYKVQVGLQAEIAEFASAIRENRFPSPSAEDSLRALKIVQAFYIAVEKATVLSLV